MKHRILPAAILLLSAAAARAEGPVGPQEDLQDELAKASLRVSKALKDNEDALAKIARGESADARAVDIAVPPKERTAPKPAPSPSPSGGEGGGEGGSAGALRGSEEHGKEVVGGIDELLRIAAQMACMAPGGGGGGKSGRPQDEEDSGEPGKQRNQKMGPEEKKDPLQDPQKDGTSKPESGEKAKTAPEKKGPVPPSASPRRPPTEKELKGIFLARLPDKVREAVDNGDFDQVPEKYRDLIREWTRALKKADAVESGDGSAGEER